MAHWVCKFNVWPLVPPNLKKIYEVAFKTRKMTGVGGKSLECDKKTMKKTALTQSAAKATSTVSITYLTENSTSLIAFFGWSW